MADNASLSILLELVDKASPQLEAFKKNFASMADTVSTKTKEVGKDGMGSQLASQFQDATGAFSEFAAPVLAGLASIQGYLSATGQSWTVFSETMAKSARQMFEQNAAMLALSDKLDELGRSADTFSKLSKEEKRLAETMALLGVSTDELLEQNMALLDSYEYSVSTVGRLTSAFVSLLNPLKAVTIAIAAFGAAGIAIGLKGFEMVDKLSDAGAKFGYTATQMLYMSSAAKDAAGSFEGVVSTYTKVAGAMVKAGEDTDKAVEAFARLGIETTNSVGEMKTASEVAYEIAVKIKQAQEEGQLSAQMMADARTVAGKSIIEEKEAIIAVTEAYKYANEQYQKGIGITKESVTAVNEYEAASTKMSNMWTVIASQFSQIVLPTFTAIKDAMLESYTSGGLVAGIFGAIKGATTALMTVLNLLAQAFLYVGFGIVALTKAIAGLAAGISLFFGAASGKGLEAFRSGMSAAMADIKKDAIETQGLLNQLRNAGTTSGGTLEKPKTPEISAPVVPKTPRGGGANEVENFIKSLKKQADTFNMSTREKTMYEAATIAATMADKKQAAAFMATTAALAGKLERLEQARTAAEEANKLSEEAIRKDEEERLKIEETIKNLRLKIEQQEFENTLSKLGTEEREAAILSRELENQKIDTTTASMTALIARYKEANQVKREQSFIESTLASTTDGKIKKQQEGLIIMAQQLEQGKITEAQWLQSVEVILNTSNDASNKVSEFWMHAAKQMQNAMSSFFFDIMQGKMTDLAGSFKKMIDKMVADYLASQLATMLFGEVTGSGRSKSSSGGLVQAAFGVLDGMFRAEGGDVAGGAPYIVGEVGPELFVPGRSGTIIPASQTASMMGGGSRSLQVSVTAMDSQDVLRAMDKIKRQLAEMMNGTNRSYNLGAR